MVVHATTESQIDILKQGRVGWIRTEVYFSEQPGPGQLPPSWNYLINIVRAIRKPPQQEVYFGINLNYPKWILDGNHDPLPSSQDWYKRLEHWGAFVKQVVTTFGPLGVKYFNIGNEPNDVHFFNYGPDPNKRLIYPGRDEYYDMLFMAAHVIHTAGYKVCAPDIATGEEHDPWDFLRGCLNRLRSFNQWLDVVTIHGYWGRTESLLNFILHLAPVLTVMREYGVSAPVWLTETGVSNLHFPSDPNRNAQRIKDLCQWIGDGAAPAWIPMGALRSKFLKKIFFYVWDDDLPDKKYAWLTPAPDLKPMPHLWNAYKSVTGGT
jgi:hypothetical protein